MGEAKPEETAKAENKPEEKVEEQKDEKAEEKKEEEKLVPPPPPPPPVVLYVDMHCVGCAKKVERCLLKCKGVEEVMVDISKNEVTIKGIVEPQALCVRLQRKTKRPVKVLSPPPPAEGETWPQIVSSQVNEVTTVILQINMHCAACAEQLKKRILKMRGVQSAEIEPSNSKVTVTGTMEAKRLVDYIYRRTGKQAIIVPPPEPEKPKEEALPEAAEPAKPAEEAPKAEEKKEEEKPEKKDEGEKPPEETKDQNKEESGENAGGGDDKKEEEKVQEPKKEGQEVYYYYNNEDMAKRIVYWPHVYVIHQPPPPQMFSDENPNACCIS